MPTKHIFTLIVIASVALSACSSSEKIGSKEVIPNDTKADEKQSVRSAAEQIDWDLLREDLSTPDKGSISSIAYFEEAIISRNDESASNNKGYRIQLERTRQLALADSIKGAYNLRMNELNIAYKAPAYVVYRAPYYRIRIGDFKDRRDALTYTKFIKRYFPSAWVVADDVDNELVPQMQNMLEEMQKSPKSPDNR